MQMRHRAKRFNPPSQFRPTGRTRLRHRKPRPERRNGHHRRTPGAKVPRGQRLLAPVRLSEKWRVVESPATWIPQWILERRERRPNAKSSGWEGKSYCVTRAGLQLAIRERCGPVDPAAMTIIDTLPEKHPNTKGTAHEV